MNYFSEENEMENMRGERERERGGVAEVRESLRIRQGEDMRMDSLSKYTRSLLWDTKSSPLQGIVCPERTKLAQN